MPEIININNPITDEHFVFDNQNATLIIRADISAQFISITAKRVLLLGQITCNEILISASKEIVYLGKIKADKFSPKCTRLFQTSNIKEESCIYVLKNRFRLINSELANILDAKN